MSESQNFDPAREHQEPNAEDAKNLAEAISWDNEEDEDEYETDPVLKALKERLDRALVLFVPEEEAERLDQLEYMTKSRLRNDPRDYRDLFHLSDCTDFGITVMEFLKDYPMVADVEVLRQLKALYDLPIIDRYTGLPMEDESLGQLRRTDADAGPMEALIGSGQRIPRFRRFLEEHYPKPR